MTALTPRQPALERRRGVALYAALAEQVEAMIGSAGLQPGDALPSEAELQTRFGVSRATVRQALSLLEQAGVIERRQGRGTFVALPPMERALPELTGFSDHVRSRGMRPSSRLVDFRQVVASDEGDGRLYPSGAPLARVVRVRYANDTPVGVHTVYLPLEVANRIGFREEALQADKSLSLYALLQQQGIQLVAADEHLTARGADSVEAKLLAVGPGTPVMSVLRKSYDQTLGLVEVVRAVYLGDKYDYVVQLGRRAGEAGIGGLVTAGGRDNQEEESI